MAKKGLNIFNSVKLSAVPSSRFNLSHDNKLSFSMGELVPTTIQECLPGDKWSISVANMLRFAPLIAPVMHKIKVTTDYYFVPNRILWPEWQDWITNKSDVGEAPYIQITGTVLEGSLADYLGVPPGTYETPIRISALPFAAYLLVYDEYYRDQNLQSPKFADLIPGDNDALSEWLSNPPLKRAWEHDYFTASLPFAQKGDAVQLPLTNTDDLTVEYQFRTGGLNQNTGTFRNAANGSPNTEVGNLDSSTGPTPLATGMGVGGENVAYDPNGTLVVPLQAEAVDINTVRRAFRLQEYLERLARGGTRYTEYLKSMFNVFSSDARLQRPEFIGRNIQNMVISEVLSHTETLDPDTSSLANPVGQMAGHGISAGGGFNGSFYCEEHGFIIGIINVQPSTAYQDGLHKMLTRFDPLDYANPIFANIGEQEVKQKEIFVFTPGDPERTFGYVPRYAEYKFANDRVAGQFRSSLAFWHLGRRFSIESGDPALNEEFIECNPRRDIFAVAESNQDHIYAHVMNELTVRRKLPRFGTPTI